MKGEIRVMARATLDLLIFRVFPRRERVTLFVAINGVGHFRARNALTSIRSVRGGKAVFAIGAQFGIAVGDNDSLVVVAVIVMKRENQNRNCGGRKSSESVMHSNAVGTPGSGH